LTGTASRAVLKDVQRELQIEDFDAIITPKSFDRPELKFRVIYSTSQEKTARLKGYQLTRELFDILGQLHGGTRSLVAEENIPEYLRFFSRETEKSFARWHDLLAGNMDCLSLDARVLEIFNTTLHNLRQSSYTWIHGDLDMSNFLYTGRWICVVDWEACGFGPASLDLGPLTARLPGELLIEYVDAYRQAYTRSSAGSLSRGYVQEWVDDGLVIDAVEWIAHYCEHRNEPGWRNWDRFYRDYVLPRVEILNLFSARTHHPQKK